MTLLHDVLANSFKINLDSNVSKFYSIQILIKVELNHQL